MILKLFRHLLRFSTLVCLMGLMACRPTWGGNGVHYHYVSPSSDGIGKVYMGREIAQVMGHEGAEWLERPSRSLEEHPQAVVDSLDLHPADRVADIGAGTGYMSFRLAKTIPNGQVFAVDIQPEMLAWIETTKTEKSINNIVAVQGSADSPNLPPESIDLALMVDAYHEFAYPREMMEGLMTALRPGGQVVLAEYRAENPFILIKRLHKMSEDQVRREMTAVGLKWQKTEESLPKQHLLFFKKPAA